MEIYFGYMDFFRVNFFWKKVTWKYVIFLNFGYMCNQIPPWSTILVTHVTKIDHFGNQHVFWKHQCNFFFKKNYMNFFCLHEKIHVIFFQKKFTWNCFLLTQKNPCNFFFKKNLHEKKSCKFFSKKIYMKKIRVNFSLTKIYMGWPQKFKVVIMMNFFLCYHLQVSAWVMCLPNQGAFDFIFHHT